MFLKVIQLLWPLSWLAYLGFSLIFYMNFDGYVKLMGSTYESQVVDVALFGVFLLLQVSIMALANLPRYLPVKALPVPELPRWVATKENFDLLCLRLKQWVLGFGLIANLALISCLFVLYYDIDQQGDTPLTYVWAIYFCGALSLGWLVYFVPLFKDAPEAG